MSGNIDKEKSCREKFLENRKDMVTDLVCATVITTGATIGAIFTESFLAGAGAAGFGFLGVDKACELYQLVKHRRQEKRELALQP